MKRLILLIIFVTFIMIVDRNHLIAASKNKEGVIAEKIVYDNQGNPEISTVYIDEKSNTEIPLTNLGVNTQEKKVYYTTVKGEKNDNEKQILFIEGDLTTRKFKTETIDAKYVGDKTLKYKNRIQEYCRIFNLENKKTITVTGEKGDVIRLTISSVLLEENSNNLLGIGLDVTNNVADEVFKDIKTFGFEISGSAVQFVKVEDGKLTNKVLFTEMRNLTATKKFGNITYTISYNGIQYNHEILKNTSKAKAYIIQDGKTKAAGLPMKVKGEKALIVRTKDGKAYKITPTNIVAVGN
jgi:predicted phosphatase